MARLVLLYNNFADAGSLSGGSWLSAFPLINMLHPDIQRVARSSGALTTATIFTLNIGKPCSIDGVVIGPVNLSPGATWRARFYSDAALTVLVYDTGLVANTGSVVNWADANDWLEWEDPGFWLGLCGASADIDHLPFYGYHVAASSFQAQYVKFEISDVANADGYIQIGRLMVSQAYRPTINYAEDSEMTTVPLVDVVESLGGRRSYWERGIRRTARYNFPMLTEEEVLDDVLSVALRASTSRQVFVVPDRDDLTTGTRRSFLATLTRAPAIRQLLVELGTTAFELEEVL
jgi:hypothetical protein